jgi:hypothetical protein
MENDNKLVETIIELIIKQFPDLIDVQKNALRDEIADKMTSNQSFADSMQSVQAIGDGSVAMGGDVSNSVIITGDNNTVAINIHGVQFPFDIPRPISWEEVRQTCRKTSIIHLEKMASKYVESLYVERKSAFGHVTRFFNSNEYRYLVISGHSGNGKTGFLYNLAETLQQDEQVAVLTMSCEFFQKPVRNPGSTPLLEMLAEGRIPAPDTHYGDYIGKLLNRVERDEGNKLVIIADAINETKSIDSIFQLLHALHCKGCDWIKVIISCRPHFWVQLSSNVFNTYGISPDYFYRPEEGNNKFLVMPGFTPEEMKLAYHKYQQYYHLKPEYYKDLDNDVKSRLREPLLLWLASEICRNDANSAKIVSKEVVGSDTRIIPAYSEKVISAFCQSHKSEHKGKTMAQVARCVLEDDIPNKMVEGERTCRNFVSEQAMSKFSDRQKDCVTEFVSRGILEQSEVGDISFRYERFYDYYFGIKLRELARDTTDLNCEPEEYYH